MSTEKINPTCMEVTQLNIIGNIHANTWYQYIKIESRKQDKETGEYKVSSRPDFLAIAILADIIYWYKLTEERSSNGKTTGWRQKFKADKLQKSYQAYADLFGLPKSAIKRAFDQLEKLNLVTREFRNLKVGKDQLPVNNVMFISPVVETIKQISYKIDEASYKKFRGQGIKSLGDTLQEVSGTNTEITTEITTICSLKEPKEHIIASEKRCDQKKEETLDAMEFDTPNQNKDNSIASQRSSNALKPIIKKIASDAPRPSELLRKATSKYHQAPKPPKPDYVCPKANQPFIDIWYEITGKKQPKKNTKTYKDSCIAIGKLRNGTFFNEKDTPTVDASYYDCKITLEEWRDVLTDFVIMRDNADYYPKNKKSIKLLTIKTFLYNGYSPVKMKSYFISCIENKPKPLVPQMKDPNPIYTNYIIEACKREFGWDLSNGDRDIAIKCADKLSKFYETNKRKIANYDYFCGTIQKQVNELLKMFEYNSSSEYPAKPTYLFTDMTYNKLLPEHLHRVGLWGS